MLDFSKPLQLSNGTPVELLSTRNHQEIIVTPLEGHEVNAHNHDYKPGSPMAFDPDTLQHVCSDLTLQNVPITFGPKTRDGRPVRILCTDRKNPDWPIIGLIEETDGKELCHSWTAEGQANRSSRSPLDLMPAPRTYTATRKVEITEVDGQVTEVKLL